MRASERVGGTLCTISKASNFTFDEQNRFAESKPRLTFPREVRNSWQNLGFGIARVSNGVESGTNQL